MATLITRLYDTKNTAAKVVKALSDSGLRESDVSLIDGADASGQLKSAGLTGSEAAQYAAKIEGGNAMVAARAPFGTALKTIKTMDATDAIDQGFTRSTVDHSGGTEEFNKKRYLAGNMRYFSSNMTRPVVNEGPAFSSRFGWKTLSSRKIFGNGIIEGSKKMFPGRQISHWSMGSSLISSGKPFLSSLIKWKTLSPAPKVQLKTENTTPFSSAMGWRTLIRRQMG